jgi:hypothetical protein
MIYKQNVTIPSSNQVVELTVSPCIKCDCDDIHIEEYEDNFGYISTAKCKYCNQEIKSNTSLSGVIKKWNESNNIILVIADRKRLIKEYQTEIKSLKSKLNNRKHRP